ncbi:MAG: asparagine synthase (glutamine-hydrolyzing) [Dehalococcoidales bacterium]
MCGIAGILGRGGNKELIKKMCKALQHRGPDDWGYYAEGDVFLGHRRLSIIDLSPKARQPISNEDGSVHLIFNGEIYNFRELRNKLEQKGHIFRSNTDSEVILHAYEDEGEKCLESLNGMFGFAIWDSKQRKLFLVRDRMGEKPLYYFYDGVNFVFASEIKAILQCGIRRKVDINALNLYLELSYVPSPYTMFQDIYKLPPAHYLILHGSQLTVQQYWDITDFQDLQGSEQSIKEEIRERLQQSVAMRTFADRPVGIFLSGGVDSTSILSAFHERNGNPVKTFSLGFEVDVERDKYNTDLNIARMTSRIFKSDHNEIILTCEEMANSFEKVIYHLDEPIANHTQSAQFLLSRTAKQDVAVVLGGDGGDEIFGGYTHYWQNQRISHYQLLPAALRLGVITPLINTFLPKYKNLNKIVNTPASAARYLLFRSEGKEKTQSLLNSDYYKNDAAVEFISTHYFSKNDGIPLAKRLMHTDLKTKLADNFLIGADKMTMASGLELRSPFLDHKLVEFAFKIPVNMKVRRGVTKYILKQAMTGMVPQEVLEGKRYFFTPAAKWLRGCLKPMIEEYLSVSSLKREGYFNADAVHKMLQAHLTQQEYNLGLLWAIFTFQVWHEQFIKRTI